MIWTWAEFTAEYPEVVALVASPFTQTWGEVQLQDAENNHAPDYWGTSMRQGIGLYAAHTITTRIVGAGLGGGSGSAGAGLGPSGMPKTREKVGDLAVGYANPYAAMLARGAVGASNPDMISTIYGQRWLALRESLRGGFLVTM